MSKTRMQPQGKRNVEIKLAVAKWKVQTGRSQKDLAMELNISPPFLSQILSGDRPGRDYIQRIDRLIRETA